MSVVLSDSLHDTSGSLSGRLAFLRVELLARRTCFGKGTLMSRLDSIYVDGIGKILVEQKVLDRFPKESFLWSEIGEFLQAVLSDMDLRIAAMQSEPVIDSDSEPIGIPNYYVVLDIGMSHYSGALLSQFSLWFHVVHSSVRCNEVERLIVLRTEPPEDGLEPVGWYEDELEDEWDPDEGSTDFEDLSGEDEEEDDDEGGWSDRFSSWN